MRESKIFGSKLVSDSESFISEMGFIKQKLPLLKTHFFYKRETPFKKKVYFYFPKWRYPPISSKFFNKKNTP
jgi:hypothetical protein